MKTEICITEGCNNRFEVKKGGKVKRLYCDDCRRLLVLKRQRQYKQDVRDGNREPQELDYRYRRPERSDATHCKYCGQKLAKLNKTGECLRECAGKIAWFKKKKKPYLPMYTPGGGIDECPVHTKLAGDFALSEQIVQPTAVGATGL